MDEEAAAPAEMNAPSLTLAQLLAGAIFVIVVIVILITDVENDEKQVIDLAKFIIPALIGGDAIVRHGRATNPNVKPKEKSPTIS
jgi:hypothetical protein